MQRVIEVMQKLPSKFQAGAAQDLNVVFQFIIDDALHYCLEICEQQCRISEQDHADPNVTLRMDSETFIDVIEGRLGGTSAFLSGRLRAEGDVMLATKLGALFKR